MTPEVDDETGLSSTGERGVGLGTRVQSTRPSCISATGAIDASALTKLATLSTASSWLGREFIKADIWV